jgi:hypothetical protein
MQQAFESECGSRYLIFLPIEMTLKVGFSIQNKIQELIDVINPILKILQKFGEENR